MDVLQLDPLAEFSADPEAEAAAKTETEKVKAETAAAEEKAQLVAKVAKQDETVTSLLKDMDSLKSKADVLDKLQEVLGKKPESPEEEFVTKEIRRRLGSDLEDLAKIKALLPALLEVVGNVAEEKQAERVNAAQSTLSSEMEKIGLDPKDEETFSAIEESVTAVIRRDEKLLAEWNSGKYKSAVTKAFDRLQSKLYAPVRSKLKRAAVTTLLDAPRSTPKGGGSSGPADGGKSVDVRDTSRGNLQKIHDAAYERFQELLDK